MIRNLLICICLPLFGVGVLACSKQQKSATGKTSESSAAEQLPAWWYGKAPESEGVQLAYDMCACGDASIRKAGYDPGKLIAVADDFRRELDSGELGEFELRRKYGEIFELLDVMDKMRPSNFPCIGELEAKVKAYDAAHPGSRVQFTFREHCRLAWFDR